MAEIFERNYLDINTLTRRQITNRKGSLSDHLYTMSTTEGLPDPNYLGDFEQKLLLIRKIYGSLDEITMPELKTARFWSGLWVLDVHSLVDIAEKLEEVRPCRAFYTYLTKHISAAADFPRLIRTFMKGYDQGKDSGVAQFDEEISGDTASSATKKCRASSSEQWAAPKKTLQEPPKRTRNKAKSDEALERDNKRCIVTNMELPKVCHIVPFALSTCKRVLWSLLHGMKVWYGEEAMNKVQFILCEEDDDSIIDEPANMLCLNAKLHEYWADGKFMLKPNGKPYVVAVEDDSVTAERQPANQSNSRHSMRTRSAARRTVNKLRWCQEMTFHWLRWTNIKMTDRVNYVWDPRDEFQPRDHETLGATSPDPWETVTDGKLIKVYADREADLPSYDLLQLQANLVTGFSLTAGADPKLYDSDGEDLYEFL
ncbi:hypothetical protein HER10_EVM0010663 [Colletotrichum scovillei]|nr:uncharacterized protein HER10_EVM0010663 [Colletotrichum scovillei]KAF4777014.1 hypothetical protein HER10_EVM0010663 [Colletotrichum scovillei]